MTMGRYRYIDKVTGKLHEYVRPSDAPKRFSKSKLAASAKSWSLAKPRRDPKSVMQGSAAR